MVPTFTLAAFHRLGAQLCPSGFAMDTPQAFSMASLAATSTASCSVSTTLAFRDNYVGG